MSIALARMQSMAADWEAVGDRRAVFADAYGRMTSAMLAAIDAGEFADDAWVGRLLDRFAHYYFVAVETHDRGTACPDVWVDAFESCRREDRHPMQLLLLGINAHINHDLVFALADVLDDWSALDAETRARRRADHEAVNRVIERTVDVVQDEVVRVATPLMGRLDDLLGPLDEWVFSRLVAGWRDDVWHDAQRLMTASGAARDAVVADVCRRTERIARLVSAS